MSDIIEEWKPMRDFEGVYEVSNLGRVRSLDRILSHGRKCKGKVLRIKISKDGYVRVNLSSAGNKRTCYMHRLVMESFYGYSKLDVNHKDGCKTNNHISNLEYVTRGYNLKHAYKLGLKFWTDEMKDKIRNNFAKTHVKGRRNGWPPKNTKTIY